MLTLPLLTRLKSYPAVKGWAYTIHGGLYLGLTNCTNCEANFVSARGPTFVMPADSGFKVPDAEEPKPDELVELLTEVYDEISGDLGAMGEKDAGVTMAGLGDPLLRVDTLIEVVNTFKDVRNGIPFRVKTWGLVDPSVTQLLVKTMYPEDVDMRRETRLASVSVCLPSSDAEQYAKLVGPRDGRGLGDVCRFISDLSEAGLAVECTTVARPDVDVDAVRRLAQSLGANNFRAVPYFE
eukprot:TRINITY_DN77698_c0_g1_i1.p1 TRINITY_DN77698_c0_g1~~TRINITY_DN77698_c0_g1_i1.p1  ORF type:complete len:238 (+),score=23.51 TRINITY_DN77698_c0_g1_i1:97-810(+)